jgi:hypothetical protein
MKPQQIIDLAARRALAAQTIFRTPEGELVLEGLRNELDGGDLRGVDTHDTYYRLGKRDALTYIEELITTADRLKNQQENENAKDS